VFVAIVKCDLIAFQEFQIHGFRTMTEADIPAAYRVLNDYLKQFKMAAMFSVDEFIHWFLPRANVVNTYVVQVCKRSCVIPTFRLFFSGSQRGSHGFCVVLSFAIDDCEQCEIQINSGRLRVLQCCEQCVMGSVDERCAYRCKTGKVLLDVML
jgi:hypothetical protein